MSKEVDAQFRRLKHGTPVRASYKVDYEVDLFSRQIDEALKEEFLASRKYFDLAEKAIKLEMLDISDELMNIGQIETEHYRKLEEIATSILKIKAKRGLI